MPYAQWHWPFENKKLFESQFPAEFIVEAIDQTRGWFYTLLAISTLLGREAPYKNVMVLGHTLDEKGAKMSKSKGNFMAAIPSIEKYGADIMRWYFLSSMPMGESKSIVPREIEDKLKGFIFTLQNCVRFYELYGEGAKVFTHSSKVTNLLDKWILSRFNNVISEVTLSLDKYDPTTASRAIEKFVVEDLSNWWLRRSRKRKEALGLLRFLLLELSKIISPFTPFIAEDIFRRLATHNSRLATHNSVHLEDWPKDDKKSVNKKLEEEMTEVRNVVTSGLAVRKEGQLKVRQPLRSATIKRSSKPSSDLEELVKEELNVKKLIYDKKQEKTVTLDIELDPSLINEGYARELIRQVQDMRKEAKYKLDAKIFGQWHSDDTELSAAINEWTEEIKKEALLKEFTSGPPSAGSSLQRGEVRAGKKSFDVAKEMELVPNKKIWVGVRK